MFCGGRCTSGPRVKGTTQYVQNLLQPRVIRTYAWVSSSPGDTLRERSSSSRESSAAPRVLDRRVLDPINATCRDRPVVVLVTTELWTSAGSLSSSAGPQSKSRCGYREKRR